LFENDTLPKYGIKTVTKSANNGVYHGPMNFLNGFRHGKGTFNFENEKLGYFEGQYKDDVRHGYGWLVIPKKEKWSGLFEHDEKIENE
jgi:hypothetical protein